MKNTAIGKEETEAKLNTLQDTLMKEIKSRTRGGFSTECYGLKANIHQIYVPNRNILPPNPCEKAFKTISSQRKLCFHFKPHDNPL